MKKLACQALITLRYLLDIVKRKFANFCHCIGCLNVSLSVCLCSFSVCFSVYLSTWLYQLIWVEEFSFFEKENKQFWKWTRLKVNFYKDLNFLNVKIKVLKTRDKQMALCRTRLLSVAKLFSVCPPFNRHLEKDISKVLETILETILGHFFLIKIIKKKQTFLKWK